MKDEDYPFKDWVDKINGYGVLFRFILPTAVIIFGTILSGKLDDIKIGQSKLETHFTNHLNHHQDLEIDYEKRLATIETQILERTGR
jgi:hypothetical protein